MARLRKVFIDHRFTQMDTDLEPVARIGLVIIDG